MRYIPTTETTVKKLKTFASGSGLSHSASLDAAAVAMGYENYHHVRHCLAHRPQDAVSVDSKTLFALLPWLLNQSPIYSGDFSALHTELTASRGIEILRQVQLEHVLRPNGTALFEEAASDHLHFLVLSGFEVPADVDLACGALAGAAAWSALLASTPEGELAFGLLYQHAFFALMVGYMRGTQDASDALGRQTGHALAGYMQDLRGARSDTAAEELFARGAQELPREMNRRWDGSEDYEQPSTLLSRICAGITLEAAGVLLTLPYQEMSAWSGGSADRVIWRMPVPLQPGARERFVAAADARRARPDAPPPGPRRFTY